MKPFHRTTMKSIRLLACLLLAAAAAGCTATTYTDPSGAKFTRTSFLSKQSIGKVDLKAGDKSLKIEGYSNEQTEIAAAVATAVANAVTQK